MAAKRKLVRIQEKGQVGLTLEDMIESGRKIREELYREQYGHLNTNRS
jgi:hypothetical protein